MAVAPLDSKHPTSADSQKSVDSDTGFPPKLGNASQMTLPLAKSPIPRTDSTGAAQQKSPVKSLRTI